MGYYGNDYFSSGLYARDKKLRVAAAGAAEQERRIEELERMVERLKRANLALRKKVAELTDSPLREPSPPP